MAFYDDMSLYYGSIDDLEEKGGKPNPGTPKDGRLSANKPGKPAADEPDGDEAPAKKPFPGAAKPFKKR